MGRKSPLENRHQIEYFSTKSLLKQCGFTAYNTADVTNPLTYKRSQSQQSRVHQTLHANLGIKFVKDEIGRLDTSYHKHLLRYSKHYIPRLKVNSIAP